METPKKENNKVSVNDEVADLTSVSAGFLMSGIPLVTSSGKRKKGGSLQRSPPMVFSSTPLAKGSDGELNNSVTDYEWNEEEGRSVKKVRIGLGGPTTVGAASNEAGPKDAEARLHERFISTMGKLGKEIKNLHRLVAENRNTKVEIKDSSERLTSLMSLCLIKEVRTVWEKRRNPKEIHRVEGVEIATQTDRTVWQLRNELSVEHIKRKMGEKGWEGFEALPDRWPEEVFATVRKGEGNPIWEGVEKNVALFISKEEGKLERGIGKQFARRYPEVEELVAECGPGDTPCVAYEAKASTRNGGSRNTTRKVISVIAEGGENCETYRNIETWAGRIAQLQCTRVAVVATGGDVSLLRRMLEHCLYDSGTQVVLYKGSNDARHQSNIPGQRNDRVRKDRRAETDAVIISGRDKQYAEILRSVRTKVNMSGLGDTIKSVRSTQKGELLLTTEKGKGACVGREVEKHLSDEGIAVRVGGVSRMALHIRGLDKITTEDDVVAEIIKVTGDTLEEGKVVVRAMRPAYGENQNALVEVPKDTGYKLLKIGKIRIGWSDCRIRERVSVDRCLRCWEIGHFARQCKGVDRRNLCLKCGKPGHKVEACSNPPACPICVVDGHRADSWACPAREQAAAANRAAKRDKPGSQTKVRVFPYTSVTSKGGSHRSRSAGS